MMASVANSVFAHNLADRLQRVTFVDSGRFALFEHLPNLAGTERRRQVLLLLERGRGTRRYDGVLDGGGGRRGGGGGAAAAAAGTAAGCGRHGLGCGHHLDLPLVAFLLLALLETHLHLSKP